MSRPVTATKWLPRELEQPDDENRWSRRLVFTGVLLATMAAAAAMAIVLLPAGSASKRNSHSD
jgi:hypothetical protein